MHGPALIGSALFLYQFLAPRCAILYTRLLFPVLFPAYSFLSPRKVGAFAGPSRLYSCVAGRKARKTDAVSSYLWRPSCIQVLFFGTDAAACPCCRLLGQIRRRAFCRKCGPPPLFGLQVPAGSPAAFGQPAGTAPTPSLYTARPICWLTFPLGSDTISIKHRKGRPAPWPSS